MLFFFIHFVGLGQIESHGIKTDITVVGVYGGPLIKSKHRVRSKCCVKLLYPCAIKDWGQNKLI